MEQGIYEQLLSVELEGKIEELEKRQMKIGLEPLDAEKAHLLLSKYVEDVLRKALIFIREDSKIKMDHRMLEQIALCNRLIRLIADQLEPETFEILQISKKSEILLSIYSMLNSAHGVNEKIAVVRPSTSIARSSLFTGSTKEPDLVSELRKEIQSSDQVDMLVSFVKWSGLRLMYEELRDFVSEPTHRLRLITTCYMGATDYGAIERLAELPNVEIKISYDTKHTRLHAKSYLFRRNTGFNTAYIGSSNMSKVAMTSGLEWNLKVTEKDSFEVIRKFQATFESYWNSPSFEGYNGRDEKDREKLRTALMKERQWEENGQENPLVLFDIRPYAYQQDILNTLQAEREIFHRYKNLVVAATGVGKTVIAAFDFYRFYKENPMAKLLFVAHREEILKQSRVTFRTVLKDPNFGELMTGFDRPNDLRHLFTTIQSFNSRAFVDKTTKDFYDFIIVDEFHHAAAESYQRLLDYYAPKILLGLTATPERMDGKNILEHFEDRIASEMRLPEAIDHKLLVPFHYFCIEDPVDLSRMQWTTAGYQVQELTNLYLLHQEARMRTVLKAMELYLTDFTSMKAIGFCVSREHAQAMTKAFNEAGISAMSVLSGTAKEERSSAKARLQSGEIKVIFTVDVYNEGVDIPCINTVLFLRPTQSLTVFLQQLGRGLRHDEEKECLTVLDFVGQAHEKYSYEERFRALLHHSNRSVRDSMEKETFSLPRGCHIKMEKVAKEYILDNIRQAILNKKNLLSKMRTFQTESNRKDRVGEFIEYHGLSMIDFYGKSGNRSYYTLKQEAAGQKQDPNYDPTFLRRYKNLFFINSKEMLRAGLDYFQGENQRFASTQLAGMYYYSFYNKEPGNLGFSDFHQGLEVLRKDFRHREEIIDILNYQYGKIDFVSPVQQMNIVSPLEIHCEYTTNQALAALGYFNEEKMPAFREGVLHLKEEEEKTDIFFITLNKCEKDFSEDTMYEDYPINERLFHWQSQNRVAEESDTALRYKDHGKLGHDILLFVRENKNKCGFVSPFVFLGKAHHVSQEGSKPVSVVWELETEMPADFLEEQLSLAR